MAELQTGGGDSGGKKTGKETEYACRYDSVG